MGIYLRFLRFFRTHYQLSMLLAVILVLSALVTVVTPYFYKMLIDTGIYQHNIKTVIQMAVIIAASLIFQELLFLGQTAITLRIRESVFSAIRETLYTHIISLSQGYFNEQNKGRLLSRITSDVDAVQNLFLDRFVFFFRNVFVGLLILGIVLTIEWKIVLAAMIFLPLLYILYFIFKKIIYSLSKSLQEKRESLMERLQEDLAMVKVLQSFSVVKERMNETIGYMKSVEKAKKKLDLNYAFASSSTIGINLIGIMAIWGIGSVQVIEGRMTIGTLVAVSFFLNYIIDLFYSAYYTVVEFQGSVPAAIRVMEVIDSKQIIRERKDAVERDFTMANIKMENVTFAYLPGKFLLKHVNAEFKPGDIIGLIGDNGQGKTTFANLLQRFIEPQEGMIAFDGIDIRNIKLSTLRRTVTVIPQEDLLFHQSISDNITLNRPGVTETQFVKACEQAKVNLFAEQLPDGYDTVVGEQGVKLSGGQKKRIIIARALLDNPYVLVLDEATSMLDGETEQAILETIASLADKKIIIIITHKTSILKYANRVIRIHEGRLEPRPVMRAATVEPR